MNLTPNKEGCYKISEHDQCCCQCTNHKPTFYHCTTNHLLRLEIEKIFKKNQCICSIQSGWACIDPLTGNIYPNWSHHSIGCEMFTQKMTTKETIAHVNSLSEIESVHKDENKY